MLAKTPIFHRFIEFCKMQGERPFNHSCPYSCALAQFGKWEKPEESTNAGYHGYYVGGGLLIEVIPYSIAYQYDLSCGRDRPRLTKCQSFADVVREFENDLATVLA